jgi:hypothetical protein
MNPSQKCQRREYCQENCIVHPKTNKLLTMCQHHWDLVKKSKKKRKYDVEKDGNVAKRPKVQTTGELNQGTIANNTDRVVGQISQAQSVSQTARQIQSTNVENTRTKTHIKVQDLGNGEKMIIRDKEKRSVGQMFIEEVEMKIQMTYNVLREKILDRNLHGFSTNKLFMWSGCKLHECKVSEILNDLKVGLGHFGDQVLEEVKQEIESDDTGWSLTAKQRQDKFRELCGDYLTFLVAHGVFPYDKYTFVLDSFYLHKLTDIEIHNRDVNLNINNSQQVWNRDAVGEDNIFSRNRKSPEFEIYVKCRMINKSNFSEWMDLYMPASTYSAYLHRWQGYESNESKNVCQMIQPVSQDSGSLVLVEYKNPEQTRELEAYVSSLTTQMKVFDKDFMECIYPENYLKTQNVLNDLNDIYNECVVENWNLDNLHLYNQAQVFLQMYGDIDASVREKYAVKWFNKIQSYHKACLEHMKKKEKEESEVQDESAEEEDTESDPYKKKQFQEIILKKMADSFKSVSEKRIRHGNPSYAMNHSRAYADEWDFANNKCNVNKKFEV